MSDVRLTVQQAQDVLRALRGAEDRLALYELHLRRVAMVLAPSGDRRPEDVVAATARDQLAVTDAVLVLQDALAGWMRLDAVEQLAQQRLDQAGDLPW